MQCSAVHLYLDSNEKKTLTDLSITHMLVCVNNGVLQESFNEDAVITLYQLQKCLRTSLKESLRRAVTLLSIQLNRELSIGETATFCSHCNL